MHPGLLPWLSAITFIMEPRSEVPSWSILMIHGNGNSHDENHRQTRLHLKMRLGLKSLYRHLLVLLGRPSPLHETHTAPSWHGSSQQTPGHILWPGGCPLRSSPGTRHFGRSYAAACLIFAVQDTPHHSHQGRRRCGWESP